MKFFLPVMTVLAVATLGLPEATGQCACAAGWSSFAGNCYRYFSNAVNWQTAQDRCEAEGANLVSIHNEAENAFAYALIITDGCNAPTGESSFAWIGYHQPPSGGDYRWSDGSAAGFENWAPSQPDNYNHGWATEDCGHLRFDPSGSWNDFTCNKLIGYICKKSA